MGRVATLLSTSARLGLTRLYARPKQALCRRSQKTKHAPTSPPAATRSFVDEFAQASASAAEAGAFTDFGAKPLVAGERLKVRVRCEAT